MTSYINLFLQGTGTTCILWITASCISLGIGIILGTVRSARIRVPILAPLADTVTFLLRGIPIYAQLMIAYFVVPQVIGLAPSATLTGILTLGLCSGAYASEVIRGAYNNIDQGQWLAAEALGYTAWQQIRYVSGPQMVRYAFPALTNEYILLLKSTAFLGSIGVLDLTKVGTNVMYRTGNPLPACAAIAVLYLGLSTIIGLLSTYIERTYYAQYK